MKRRGAISLIGATALGGCLRLSDTRRDGASGTNEERTTATPLGTDSDPTRSPTESERPTRTEQTATDTEQPETSSRRITAELVKFSIGADGEVRNEIQTGAAPNETVHSFDTAGDSSIYESQVFANYVVELVEGGDVIGSTAAKINQHGYRWRFAQTEETAYITRHPSVRTDWRIDVLIDGEPVPAGSVSVRDDVFAVDLTAAGVESGIHEISVKIGNSYGFIPSVSQYPLVVGSNPNDRTEQEAVEYAATPVQDVDRQSLGEYAGGGPNRIEHSDTLVYTYSANEATVSTSRWIVITAQDDPVTIGPERSLRVRNVTTGESLTYSLSQ